MSILGVLQTASIPIWCFTLLGSPESIEKCQRTLHTGPLILICHIRGHDVQPVLAPRPGVSHEKRAFALQSPMEGLFAWHAAGGNVTELIRSSVIFEALLRTRRFSRV